MIRMGREADDVVSVMRADGDIRTGVSSPKRYLWADDSSWLEGANWHMADTADRCHTGAYAATLQGPLLRYIHEDDRDFLLEDEEPQENQFAPETPTKPRHAPRAMMTAALYELLCQAYSFVNSPAYRNKSGEAGRTREIRTLTLTYPTGMIQAERDRLAAQGNKAIRIFARTLGKNQRVRPELNLGIDEASAVHLTYIWSELRMLGQDPRLWFAALRQDRERKPPAAEEPAGPAALAPAASRRGRPGLRRPGDSRRAGGEPEAFGDPADEIRIACINVGGGTTDLMIAKYNFESKIDDSIRGQVLHQDGISLGGDQLVKRLLETIVVPHFAEVLGLEDEDVQLLFGPEAPQNRGLRSLRLNWINRLFVPLAQAYLTNAGDDLPDPISHTDPEIVDPTIVESLQKACDKLRGPGYYNVQQELDLAYDRVRFEGVVHDVFDELLFDFCSRIAEHEADVVLLAGPALEARPHPAVGEDVRAAFALAHRADAQQLRRQLVSVPGRVGAQSRGDRRSEEPRRRRRGGRVHGAPRDAAAVQVRDEDPHPGKHVLLGRDDRRHLRHPPRTHPFHRRRGPGARGDHRVQHEFAAGAHRPEAQRRRGRPGDAGLPVENGRRRPHRRDADPREAEAKARLRRGGRDARVRVGRRHGRRRGRRPRRERFLLLADPGRRALLPQHRRIGQHRTGRSPRIAAAKQ